MVKNWFSQIFPVSGGSPPQSLILRYELEKETEIGLVQTWSTGFGQDFKTEIWPIFWGWCLLGIWQYLEIQLGTKIYLIYRGEVIPRTWFHSFFSRKKSEIRIAFTFFEKWKVKNKIPSLFFEKWKWNWNGSRSRTRSENEKKFSRILEKRESRWSLPLQYLRQYLLALKYFVLKFETAGWCHLSLPSDTIRLFNLAHLQLDSTKELRSWASRPT